LHEIIANSELENYHEIEVIVGKKILLIITFIQFLSLQIFAHGEDKPGPHQGYIRMPGAFHTEVVKIKEGYRIYLLDMNWKNPSVADSSVKATIVAGKRKTDLSCTKENDSYLCKTNLKERGRLEITAKREGQMGNTVQYKLPLKFEDVDANHEDHKE
jgi:hypothetical protein